MLCFVRLVTPHDRNVRRYVVRAISLVTLEVDQTALAARSDTDTRGRNSTTSNRYETGEEDELR